MPAGVAPVRSEKTLRVATGALAAFVSIVMAIWIWSRICDFPAQPWNDLRVATSVALSQGWPVFPTAEHGTINTWTYGPLPLVFFWPAAWATTAGGAMMVAAVLNVALCLGSIMWMCFRWPATDASSGFFGRRAIAFGACLALWPERIYALHSADNLAIACGLVATVILMRAKSPAALWSAAILASAAVACKQTAAGIALAHVLWLGLTVGWRPAFQHALRCAVIGVGLLGACAIAFGGDGLRFVLWELPAHFRWAPDPLERLASVAPELALQIGLPFAIMAVAWRRFRQPDLLLPALLWICALPLGFSALLKFGGRMNSFYGFVLWLPPVMVIALDRSDLARRAVVQLAALLLVLAVSFGRIIGTPRFYLRPQLDDYHDAQQITAQFHDQVWFPLHPLITLYSDHRYYHDEDGFFVRRMTHKAVTPAHAAEQLPAGFRAIAFREGWSDFGIAKAMLPANVLVIPVGQWSVCVIDPNRVAP